MENMIINNWKPENENQKFRVYSFFNPLDDTNQPNDYLIYSEEDIKLFNSVSKNYELVPVQNIFNNSIEFYMIYKNSPGAKLLKKKLYENKNKQNNKEKIKIKILNILNNKKYK